MQGRNLGDDLFKSLLHSGMHYYSIPQSWNLLPYNLNPLFLVLSSRRLGKNLFYFLTLWSFRYLYQLSCFFHLLCNSNYIQIWKCSQYQVWINTSSSTYIFQYCTADSTPVFFLIQEFLFHDVAGGTSTLALFAFKMFHLFPLGFLKCKSAKKMLLLLRQLYPASERNMFS